MDVPLFLLAFTLFWKSSQCVRCYKCNPETVPYDPRETCQHFDSNPNFIVDCDSSTMCYKRTITLDLGNGLITTSVKRGCASQTLDGDQRKVNGKWVQVNDIYEVYEESCKEQPSDYQRATKTLDCYCRGELCNAATHKTANLIMPMSLIGLHMLIRQIFR